MSTSDSPQSSAIPSQNIGNITSNGSNNKIAVIQSLGDATIDQSTIETVAENSDLQTILQAIQKLKQGISTTENLNLVEKKQTEFTLQMLEEELQKNKPDKSFIDQTVAALKKGLEAVTTLAAPVTQVAELVAQAWFL